MDLFAKLKEMKILLVDDDEWIRDSLSIYFENEGCQLQALETAEEGMESLKRQAYDIIISDYKLPGINGLEFLKFAQATHPDGIKILITAYKSEEVISEAMRIGVHDFLEKPFTTKSIETSLSRLVGNH